MFAICWLSALTLKYLQRRMASATINTTIAHPDIPKNSRRRKSDTYPLPHFPLSRHGIWDRLGRCTDLHARILNQCHQRTPLPGELLGGRQDMERSFGRSFGRVHHPRNALGDRLTPPCRFMHVAANFLCRRRLLFRGRRNFGRVGIDLLNDRSDLPNGVLRILSFRLDVDKPLTDLLGRLRCALLSLLNWTGDHREALSGLTRP